MYTQQNLNLWESSASVHKLKLSEQMSRQTFQAYSEAERQIWQEANFKYRIAWTLINAHVLGYQAAGLFFLVCYVKHKHLFTLLDYSMT